MNRRHLLLITEIPQVMLMQMHADDYRQLQIFYNKLIIDLTSLSEKEEIELIEIRKKYNVPAIPRKGANRYH